MPNIEDLKEKYKAYYDLDSGSKEALKSIEEIGRAHV